MLVAQFQAEHPDRWYGDLLWAISEVSPDPVIDELTVNAHQDEFREVLEDLPQGSVH
jgi:hypothetical protein